VTRTQRIHITRGRRSSGEGAPPRHLLNRVHFDAVARDAADWQGINDTGTAVCGQRHGLLTRLLADVDCKRCRAKLDATLPTTAVRIPHGFFDDHRDRALPTPEILRHTGRHYWIDTAAAEYAALISDARYYADQYGPDGAPHVVRMAKDLLRAVTKGGC